MSDAIIGDKKMVQNLKFVRFMHKTDSTLIYDMRGIGQTSFLTTRTICYQTTLFGLSFIQKLEHFGGNANLLKHKEHGLIR